MKIGFPDEWREVVNMLYEQLSDKIRTQEGLLEIFNNDVGVKQGCPSPILFGLYMDKLEDWINEKGVGVNIADIIKIVLYADDVILIARTLCSL